jgi:hypothetical protein
MVLIPALLGLVTVLKLVSISNAIRWLAGDAGGYRTDVSKNKPQTVLALEVALQVSHRAGPGPPAPCVPPPDGSRHPPRPGTGNGRRPELIVLHARCAR